MLPEVRVSAPSDVKIGEAFKAKVSVKLQADLSYSALAVTLVWDVKKLEAVGEPSISKEIYSADNGKLFDIILVSRNDSVKGVTEIALGNWKDGKIPATTGELMVAEQMFRVKGTSGVVNIELSNDSAKTSNGTMCFVGKKELGFKLFMPARINAN